MTFYHQDEQLNKLGNQVLEQIWQEFPKLRQTQIAFTWVVYDPPVIVNTGGALSPEEFWQYSLRGFSYRGKERIYPASLVKLFYLVAIEEWLNNGMIPSSPENERAIHDMIVLSSNDATSLVVDLLTGTTSGPELTAGPFATWKHQRNIVNRYFQSLGWQELEDINVNQKTWSDGAYGRERAFLGEMRENRNMLTSEAIARLLHSIVGGVAVSSQRSQKMMSLLKRSLNPQELVIHDGEDQITSFLGQSLPHQALLWSKAGWTTQVRHDTAYIEVPELQPYLLTVLTETQNKVILPFISQAILAATKQLSV